MAKRKTKPVKSYVSLMYGALTLILVFLILFFGLKSIQQRTTSITPEAENTTILADKYEVKSGDTLWAIAEEKYKDGHKWSEIAKANNVSNPNTIEKGMKLTIPEVPVKTELFAAESTGSASTAKVTGTTYKIVEGDTLWDISVRAYGDGYKWPEVARANNIQNPDLIYAGNTLTLPR